MDPLIEYCAKILIPHIDRTLAKVEEMQEKGERIDMLLFPEVESRLLHFITTCLLRYKYLSLKPKLLRIMASTRLIGGFEKNRKHWAIVNSATFYREFKKHCRDVSSYDQLKGIKGKKVAVIDDVIETGRTIIDTSLYVKELGGSVRLVSAIEAEKEGAGKIMKQLRCPVLYAGQLGKSLPRTTRDKDPGFRAMALGISILFSPEMAMEVSQKGFSKIYDDIRADETFDIVGLLLLKEELTNMVKSRGISKEKLEKAKWMDEPYRRVLEKVLGQDALKFLYSLDRKEWFEQDNKDLGLRIRGFGKLTDFMSEKLVALKKKRPRPKDEIEEIEEDIKEEQGKYAAFEHPFEFTPYRLHALKIYACSKETHRKVIKLKRSLDEHIRREYGR